MTLFLSVHNPGVFFFRIPDDAFAYISALGGSITIILLLSNISIYFNKKQVETKYYLHLENIREMEKQYSKLESDMKNVVELLGIEKLKNFKNDQNLEGNFQDEILKVP